MYESVYRLAVTHLWLLLLFIFFIFSVDGSSWLLDINFIFFVLRHSSFLLVCFLAGFHLCDTRWVRGVGGMFFGRPAQKAKPPATGFDRAFRFKPPYPARP